MRSRTISLAYRAVCNLQAQIRTVPALFLIAVVFANAAPLSAQRSSRSQAEIVLGQGGPQEIVLQLLQAGFKGHDYQALILSSIRNQASADVIDLSASPLWRLDLRRAVDLQPPSGQGGPNAPWTLIPPRQPGRDDQDPTRWILAGPLWFLLPEQGGLTSLSLIQISTERAELRWEGVQLAEFPGEFTSWAVDAVVDVTVVMSLDQEGYLQAELQVDLDNPPVGDTGAALLSAEFPALLLPALEFGDEPDPTQDGWVDDLLLTSYEGGGLIPDPVSALEFPDLDFLDSIVIDNRKPLGAPYAPHKITYPGRIPTQFYYYYDLRQVADTADAWADYANNGKMLARGTPAGTRGGGAGVFLATLDPERNVKRLHQYAVHFKKQNKPPTHLGLGIRNFFRFEAADHPLLQAGQQDWTYYLGPGLSSEPFLLERRLDYPATIRVLDGDWFDAASHYRDWLERPHGSEALLRDAGGLPIALRDRADPGLAESNRIPEPYLWMSAIVGLGETGPNGFDPLSQDMIGAELFANTGADYTEYVREYVNWLRVGSAFFNGTPWFAIGHGESMQDDTGADFAIKSSGTDEHNRLPRPGLIDFHKAMRNEDALEGWIGAILMTTNRDTGRSEGSLPLNVLAHTERGVSHATGIGQQTSYGRGHMVTHITELLKQHLDLFEDPVSGEAQVDWLLLSGQGSETKPDASLWFHSDPLQQGAFGGRDWPDGLEQVYRNVLELSPHSATPSPFLYSGCERLHEGSLRHVFPLGPSHGHPISAGADDKNMTGPGKHRALFEPVPLVPTLFHEYTILRGRLTSHALYALSGVAKPIGGAPDGPLPGPEEYERSQRLISHRLTTEILSHGRLPTVFVSGDRAGLDWTFSDRVGLGPDDGAEADFAKGEPMWYVRQLLRARMTAQAFLIAGRKEREVELIPAASQTGSWFATEIEVDQHGSDAADEQVARLDFGALSIPRLVSGTWGVRGGADTPVGQVHILIVVANSSQDDGTVDFDTDYELRFDPSQWDLPPGQYVLRAHRFDWSTPSPYPGTDPVFQHDDVLVQGGPRTIEGQGVQFWSVTPSTVSASRTLSLEVMDRLDPVQSGNLVMYEIAVTNHGHVGHQDLTVETTMPEGCSLVGAVGCTAGKRSGAQLNFEPVPDIAPGEKLTWRLLFRTHRAGALKFGVRMYARGQGLFETVEETRVR